MYTINEVGNTMERGEEMDRNELQNDFNDEYFTDICDEFMYELGELDLSANTLGHIYSIFLKDTRIYFEKRNNILNEIADIIRYASNTAGPDLCQIKKLLVENHLMED